MYLRKQFLPDVETDSVLLFGARQTGKSVLLKTLFPNSLYFDLLETNLRNRLREHPDILCSPITGRSSFGTLFGFQSCHGIYLLPAEDEDII